MKSNVSVSAENPDRPAKKNDGRVRVTFYNSASNGHAIVLVRPNLTTAQVIQRLQQIGVLTQSLTSQQRYVLTLERTSQQLTLNNTLYSAGVKNDDNIVIDVVESRDTRQAIDLFHDIQLFSTGLPTARLAHEWPGVFVLLLYSEIDRWVSHYVRMYYREIQVMSHQACQFFVLESPSPQLQFDRQEWTGGRIQAAQAEAAQLEPNLNSYKPFDKRTTYELGQKFGIRPMQCPCALVFSVPAEHELLIVPFSDFVGLRSNNPIMELTAYFRTLFSSIDSILGKPRPVQLINLKKLLDVARVPKPRPSTTTLQIVQLEMSVGETIDWLATMLLR